MAGIVHRRLDSIESSIVACDFECSTARSVNSISGKEMVEENGSEEKCHAEIINRRMMIMYAEEMLVRHFACAASRRSPSYNEAASRMLACRAQWPALFLVSASEAILTSWRGEKYKGNKLTIP